MTNNVRINHEKNTIVISQKVAKKAEIYGTDEYMLLQRARKDYPEFSVTIEEKKNCKRDTMKGLTYDFMRNYIEKHDPNGDIMEEYQMLLGESDLGLGLDDMEGDAEDLSDEDLADFDSNIDLDSDDDIF